MGPFAVAIFLSGLPPRKIAIAPLEITLLDNCRQVPFLIVAGHSDPAFAAHLTEMCGRLDAWMEKTNDPILNGPIAMSRRAKAREASRLGRNQSSKSDG